VRVPHAASSSDTPNPRVVALPTARAYAHRGARGGHGKRCGARAGDRASRGRRGARAGGGLPPAEGPATGRVLAARTGAVGTPPCPHIFKVLYRDDSAR